jgi:hypothetical protein
MTKKAYVKPELIAHGNVEDITLQGGRPNTDVPQGADGTAFPAAR